MRLLAYDNTRVIVEADGVVLEAELCVDRYRLGRRWPISQREMCVEIWELPDGGVLRLSRDVEPEARWYAEPWV